MQPTTYTPRAGAAASATPPPSALASTLTLTRPQSAFAGRPAMDGRPPPKLTTGRWGTLAGPPPSVGLAAAYSAPKVVTLQSIPRQSSSGWLAAPPPSASPTGVPFGVPQPLFASPGLLLSARGAPVSNGSSAVISTVRRSSSAGALIAMDSLVSLRDGLMITPRMGAFGVLPSGRSTPFSSAVIRQVSAPPQALRAPGAETPRLARPLMPLSAAFVRAPPFAMPALATPPVGQGVWGDTMVRPSPVGYLTPVFADVSGAVASGPVAIAGSARIVAASRSPLPSPHDSPKAGSAADVQNAAEDRENAVQVQESPQSSAGRSDAASSPGLSPGRGEFVPYSRRQPAGGRKYGRRSLHSSEASIGSRLSRESSMTRCQVLYQDHDHRQRKLQAKAEEQHKQAEAKLLEQLQSTVSRRSFDKNVFDEWYKDKMDSYKAEQQCYAELLQEERRIRDETELAECTFRPRSSSPTRALGRIGVDLSVGTVGLDGRGELTVSESSPRATTAHGELAAVQAKEAAKLQQLAARDSSMRTAARQDAEQSHMAAVDESRRRLHNFLQSSEGQAFVTDRAREYLKLNRGMDERVAWREAQGDLLRASEERLRAQTETVVAKRMRQHGHAASLARLLVLQELIRLQRRWQSLVATQGPPAAGSSPTFDETLLDRLTKEPWYTEARDWAAKVNQEVPKADAKRDVTACTAAARGK